MIRNKLFIFIVCFGVFPAFAATRVQLQSELAALDSEIASLEAEYEKKTSLLQTCEKKSNNLKTAGIVTLAGTGVGVAGNIALHKKYTDSGSGSGGGVSSTINAEQASRNNKNKICSNDKVPQYKKVEIGC